MISQQAPIRGGAHDFRRADLRLVKGRIRIGEDAWICSDAFVDAGATVGAYAVVGARAVAVKDVPAPLVVASNPARIISPRWAEGAPDG